MGKKIGKRNDYHDKKHLQKMQVPMFDGNTHTPRAWLQKLQTYFTLFPMRETDAIIFSSLYLDGIAYEWWHNGFTTLGLNKVIIFEEFFQRVIEKFERKDK